MTRRVKVKKTEKKTAARKAFMAAVGPSVNKNIREASVTLTNGVKLKLRSVSPTAVREAVMRLERPKPPRVMNETKGREEENPQHPDYLTQVEEYEAATQEAAANVLLLLGTEVEHVPEEVPILDTDDWVEDLRYVGVLGEDFDGSNPRARKLAWLKFVAMTSLQDTVMVLGGPLTALGVSESEVAETIQSFRGDEKRGADPADAPETHGPDGAEPGGTPSGDGAGD